ncbi:hypothetical protein [Kordiimonas sp.]|uniref:hypothetical protein n=1 Tax=Kordiimonas sp. TaxID=1970157 RepID=UPI003B515B80
MTAEIDTGTEMRSRLLAAGFGDELLSTIYAIVLMERKNRDLLYGLLVELHNSSHLDIIGTFLHLRNSAESGRDYFLLRRAFEKAMPYLHGSVERMMQCIMHLTKEAGNDLSSGTLLPLLTDWLAADEDRQNEAFSLLEARIDQYGSLMPQIVQSGCRSDPEKYINYCIRLLQVDDIELRRKAMFSVGRIPFSEAPGFAKVCALAIATSIKLNDDRLRGIALKTLFHICQSNRSVMNDTIGAIEFLLENPEEHTLHAAAELFAWELKDIPEGLLATLLQELQNTPILNSGTWDFIDQGVCKLIEAGQRDVALCFIESLSGSVPDLDVFQTFASTRQAILADKDITSRIVTRWLLAGGNGLKNFVARLVLRHSTKTLVCAHKAEFEPDNPVHVVFLARKAIGYFFLDEASSATTFILSLMNLTSSHEALEALTQLLEDPLLLNYPADVEALLKKPLIQLTPETQECINRALSNSEKYYEALRNVGNLPELFAPKSEQELHMKNMAAKTQQAMKAGEAKSVLLSMVSKSVILHGNKAAFTITDLNGQPHRSEIAMQSHGHSMTVPRMSILTPYDLDLMLRIFRVERIKQ